MPQPKPASYTPDLTIRPNGRSNHLSSALNTPPSDQFGEIGTSGLKQYGGFVLEEWLQALSGRRGAWVWREMLDNDPTVGAIMFAIKWLARGVEWRVDEGDGGKSADAELVEQCMHDMSHTWGDFISEAISMLPYGWAWHEIVYKTRKGQQDDLAVAPEFGEDGTQENDANVASSKYKDGLIGWRKLPIRAQETLLKWQFDGYSGIQAMNQIDWHGGNHIIPIEKSLLFRTQTTRNNPEGRSILRNAFTSYHALKNIKNTEAIGVERDLAGIPTITPPDDFDLFAPQNAALFEAVKQLVSNVRRDEYEGLVLPAGWTFELVSSAGSRQIDTDAIIRRYRADIAMSVLADFVLIGQDNVGSFAMVDVKSDLFGMAIDGILDLICEVMNRYAVPRLLQMNGRDISDPPTIEHGSAGRFDLEKVGAFLFQLAGAGAPIPWSKAMVEMLLKESGLPSNTEEDVQEDLPAAAEPVGPDGQPVVHAAGPAVLPAGTDPYAREAHAEPGPAPATPPPGSKVAPTPKAVPVAKAEGTAFDVGARLRARHQVLSAQLESDLNYALAQLGYEAASSYQRTVTKASASMLHRIVGRIVSGLNLGQWVQNTLRPLLENHASRVTADTLRTISTEIGLQVTATEAQVRKIADTAGNNLGMRDIEPQVRQSILDAIKKGVQAGENPVKTAARIRSDVPAGRFVNAGAQYRSRLIARDQTANMMREASLAAYDSNDNITGVRLRDGIFGEPRSDSECIARDGMEVSKEEAASVHPNHPQCTLSYDPVVSGGLRVPDERPELITV